MRLRSPEDKEPHCSFCHKSQDVVGKLISSPSDSSRAYICDECIAVCNSIIEDDAPPGVRDPYKNPLTPQLFDVLRQWVVLPAESGASELAGIRRFAEQIFLPTDLDRTLSLPAGADLDALVHAKFFGADPQPEAGHPAYSSDMGAAWMIVEHLGRLLGLGTGENRRFLLRFAGRYDPRECDAQGCAVAFHRVGETDCWGAHFHLDRETYCALGETAPLAICRAALKM